LEDGNPADGHVTGSAQLHRKKEGIRIEVNTTELGAGYAYTNWWIIFNNPEHCAGGAGGCNGDDFSNPDVEGSVLYATGRVADSDGNATFRAFLPVGLIRADGQRHLFGPGLQDPKKAEVHYVIRSHGPASTGSDLHAQLSTVGGLCSVVNPCFDPQAIVFPK